MPTPANRHRPMWATRAAVPVGAVAAVMTAVMTVVMTAAMMTAVAVAAV
jgi:hypothetical protein